MRDSCSSNFINFSFRGTCVSLDDFDNFYGYSFEKKTSDLNLDYLISFCEYSYNLVVHNQGYDGTFLMELHQSMQFYIKQVLQVIESVAYMANMQNGVIDFIPKDQVAISVAEMVDSTLSYRVIKYNHHSMKGDLERKRATLIALADKLEPNRKKLKEFNNALDSDLFYLLNSVKI